MISWLEIPKETGMAVRETLAAANGYLLMSESQGRIIFNKGCHTERPLRELFPSAFALGEGIAMNFLLFRDYLQEHPTVAEDYWRRTKN